MDITTLIAIATLFVTIVAAMVAIFQYLKKDQKSSGMEQSGFNNKQEAKNSFNTYNINTTQEKK